LTDPCAFVWQNTHAHRVQQKTLLRLHLDVLKKIGTSEYESNEINAILRPSLQGGKKNTLFPIIRNNKIMDA